MTYYEQVNREFHCDHDDQTYRRLVASNGITHYRLQCQRCGNKQPIKKSDVPSGTHPDSLPEVDESIGDRWRSRRMNRFKELADADLRERELERQEESDQWWSAYRRYLTSDEWKHKRDLVMQRADHTCEGCLQADATQVHHLTYEHVGRELLWELRAVCDACHQTCHPDKSLGSGKVIAA